MNRIKSGRLLLYHSAWMASIDNGCQPIHPLHKRKLRLHHICCKKGIR